MTHSKWPCNPLLGCDPPVENHCFRQHATRFHNKVYHHNVYNYIHLYVIYIPRKEVQCVLLTNLV